MCNSEKCLIAIFYVTILTFSQNYKTIARLLSLLFIVGKYKLAILRQRTTFYFSVFCVSIPFHPFHFIHLIRVIQCWISFGDEDNARERCLFHLFSLYYFEVPSLSLLLDLNSKPISSKPANISYFGVVDLGNGVQLFCSLESYKYSKYAVKLWAKFGPKI